MTGILDRIRATTPETLAGVTGDFSDLPPSVYRPSRPKNMVRTVEGADDLRHPMAGRKPRSNGGSIVQDWSDKPDLAPARESVCLECGQNHGGASCGPRDARSEGQVRYMNNLISWIMEKDAVAGAAAREWTDNVTAAGKWSWGKADKFSISGWIDRLKAKNEALNEAAKNTPVTPAGSVTTSTRVEHDALIVRETKTDKPLPVYYAVEEDGELHFFKIKAGTKPGWWWISIQASDEFHPIKNVTRKNAILNAIVEAGPEACMRRYGNEIGSCGRCHRTLTDPISRANGIGPECEGML